MRSFLIKLLIFLFLLFAGDRLVGALLHKVYTLVPHGVNWTKVNWLNSQQFDIVILGSSRTLRHYVPQVISSELKKSVFNAGQNGQYLLYAYALEQLLLDNYTPEIIVLDVLPSYITQLDNSEQEYERLEELSPFVANKEVKRLITQDKFFYKVKYFSNMYQFNSKILSMLDNIFSPAGENDNGFEKVGNVKFHDRNPFIVDTMEEIKLDSMKIQILESFILKAKERGVQIVFAVSPVSQKLSEKAASLFRFYKNMAEKNNIPYFDFSTHSSTSGVKDNFMDIIHMNERGARMYSHVFANQLKLYQGSL